MTRRTPTPAPGAAAKHSVVKPKSPIIAPDELVTEVAAGRRSPAHSREALELAVLVLTEGLKDMLNGFPYRDQPTHPVAVWARVYAVALEACRSALSREDYTRLEIHRILDACILESKGGASC